jgi:hypothetical protein
LLQAAYATAQTLGAMADALKTDGIATWNIEYGGWDSPAAGGPVPTSMSASRRLRPVSLSRWTTISISAASPSSDTQPAGTWRCGRRHAIAIPEASELYVTDPLPLRGVMDLAGPVDMTANIPGYEALCRGHGHHLDARWCAGCGARTLRGSVSDQAIAVGIPQVLVLGSHEDYVPLPLVDAYVEAATRAGDHVRRILIPGAGHFEIASPLSFTWPQVKAAIGSLLDGKLSL